MTTLNQAPASAVAGALLGCAVGDALGLPMEGINPRRAAKMFPDLTRYHLLPNRGMVSDDTEHTVIIAHALASFGGDLDLFSHTVSSGLKRWVLAAPAGIGFATLRACTKLLLGISPATSGVFSAGNGPAMRAGIIGAAYGHDVVTLRALVRASTAITHTDPKAYFGSMAVAVAALCSAQGICRPAEYIKLLAEYFGPDQERAKELFELIAVAHRSAVKMESTRAFVTETMGYTKGVSGYIYHTVPAALHAWWRHPTDFHGALVEIIRSGGDTDTAGAIVGSIVGAGVGIEGIPSHLLDTLMEWPMNVDKMIELGNIVAYSVDNEPFHTTMPPYWQYLIRNGLFTLIVLTHGFRRLFPPYQ